MTGESDRLGNWRRVWRGRPLDDESATPSLETIMEIDGFGATDPAAWSAGIGQTRTRLGVQPGDTIFDVGCGAGAFLYPLVHQFRHRVGGIDYSEGLVETARRAMPGMQFSVAEASLLDEDERYDFVVAHSTFQYFPTLDYAGTVLRRMMNKARKAVAVLDVSDAARRDDLESLRRGSLPDGEYEQRYSGLDHLYYDRSWFEEFARAAGARVEVFEQAIPTYETRGLRFNVLLSY